MLRERDVETLKAALAERFAPATANKMQSCLRGVLRACRNMGLMTAAKCESLVGVPNIPATWHPAEVQRLTATQIRQLFESCASNTTLCGRRDAALLAIFLVSGLRRAEAAALNVGDVGENGATLAIRSPEPHKNRTVPLAGAARRYVQDWLGALDGVADPSTPLLLPVNKSGRVHHRRLTDQAIYGMVRRVGIEAGLNMVTSRALRFTYVMNLIAKGLPVGRVQALVGHASWVTTQAYHDLAEKSAADRVEPFQLPYVKPRVASTTSTKASTKPPPNSSPKPQLKAPLKPKSTPSKGARP
jgi:site-specific recombinase XerD